MRHKRHPRLLFPAVRHLKAMYSTDSRTLGFRLRTPAEPSLPPVQEPIDPPENPDVPVREPDPEDPGQI